VRQQYFQALGNGSFHRIAYTEWGQVDTPHVVICVHGLARNSRDFDYLAAALTPECRVVCMDVAGRGESDWLANKAQYTFSTYQSDADGRPDRPVPRGEEEFADPAPGAERCRGADSVERAVPHEGLHHARQALLE
jgi:pimeloyl-ACP methyl ester carboxylesterase